MNRNDVEHVWQTLRKIGIEPHNYVDCYRDVCTAILNTITPLSDMWSEGLRAIVDGEGREQWGKKRSCFYDLYAEYDWMWAIRFMSHKPLNEYIEEFC